MKNNALFNTSLKRVALLTKHGKEAQIAPVLRSIDFELELVDTFDTDTLGTFSGEIERTLSPLECAKKKARLACQLSKHDLGLGSEGSFGGGPLAGLMNWDTEILVLHDAKRNLDIVATESGPVNLTSFNGDNVNQLKTMLSQVDENQAWIVKVGDKIIKGIATVELLFSHLTEIGLLANSELLTQTISVTPDLRAMHCPQRQVYISQTAQQLVKRIESLCPECQAPDFWIRDRITGLPCQLCHAPTDLTKAIIRKCLHCDHQHVENSTEKAADPYRCHWCNP
ncbi:DUF6671 family protein [Thalassotalea ganghwensis]